MNDLRNDGSSPTKQFLIWAAMFEGGTAVLALGLGWWLSKPPWMMVQWRIEGVVGGVLAALPLIGVVIGSVHFGWGPLARLSRIVQQMLLPLFRSASAIDLAVISILAGLGEELLFRGVIQYQIEVGAGESIGPWVGLIAASISFGLLHWVTFGYAVLAGAIGLYLGWLWLATGNLLVPIVTHAFYDWVVLVYLVKVRAGDEVGD